jgi:NTE family protein
VSQGISPARLHAALLAGDDPFFPLRQRDIAAMDLLRAARLAGTAARFAASAFFRMLTGRRGAARGTGAALPAGLLSIEPYRRFVAETLRAGGLSDDFRSLARPLLVPATDLDSARRVVFGEPPWDDVPISTAVAASSAIPTFFEPVSVRGRHLVDGNVGKVAHLDLAISRGVRRVLVVSPLARVDLIEPDPADATLFLANPMSLAARREILENAYAQARGALARREVGATLAA